MINFNLCVGDFYETLWRVSLLIFVSGLFLTKLTHTVPKVAIAVFNLPLC